ncbi:MAG TPA: hypothetical protein VKR58_08735, partial [Aquella sp.]|nr:hypothetical protein [Aquella sp.]
GENIEALTDIKKTTLGGTVTGFLPAGPIKYNQLTQITGTNSGTPWIIRKLNPDESAYRSGVWEVTGTGYLKGYNAVKGYYLCTQWEECSTCSVS